MANLICAADMKQFDPLNLASVIRTLEAQGIDELHFDAADGRFIPRFGFAPATVAAARNLSSLPCHLHLMIDQPEAMLSEVLTCGANTISLHLETCIHMHRALSVIKDAGITPGLAVSAATALTKINYLLPLIGRLLLLGADPLSTSREMPRAAFERIRIASENIRYHEYAIAVESEGPMPIEDAARGQRFGAHRIVVGPRDVPGLGDPGVPDALRKYRDEAAAAAHTV